MKYSTAIDTIGLQVDFDNTEEQHYVMTRLLDYLRNTGSFFLQNNSIPVNANVTYFNHAIIANNTVIAKIHTGFFTTVKEGKVYPKFYINITFAGLKRYNDIADYVSNDCLMKICAFLNRSAIRYKLTEMDVCIDIECPFEHMMAFCVKKSPKTKYYAFEDRQAYKQTQYIEKISSEKVGSSVLRAYYYDKHAKESLPYYLTRFELKLQNKYFNKYGVSVESIQKALNRYYVLYFKNTFDKYVMMDIYRSQPFIRSKQALKLGFEPYRIYPDIMAIKHYLDQMFNAGISPQ